MDTHEEIVVLKELYVTLHEGKQLCDEASHAVITQVPLSKLRKLNLEQIKERLSSLFEEMLDEILQYEGTDPFYLEVSKTRDDTMVIVTMIHESVEENVLLYPKLPVEVRDQLTECISKIPEYEHHLVSLSSNSTHPYPSEQIKPSPAEDHKEEMVKCQEQTDRSTKGDGPGETLIAPVETSKEDESNNDVEGDNITKSSPVAPVVLENIKEEENTKIYEREQMVDESNNDVEGDNTTKSSPVAPVVLENIKE